MELRQNLLKRRLLFHPVLITSSPCTHTCSTQQHTTLRQAHVVQGGSRDRCKYKCYARYIHVCVLDMLLATVLDRCTATPIRPSSHAHSLTEGVNLLSHLHVFALPILLTAQATPLRPAHPLQHAVPKPRPVCRTGSQEGR